MGASRKRLYHFLGHRKTVWAPLGSHFAGLGWSKLAPPRQFLRWGARKLDQLLRTGPCKKTRTQARHAVPRRSRCFWQRRTLAPKTTKDTKSFLLIYCQDRAILRIRKTWRPVFFAFLGTLCLLCCVLFVAFLWFSAYQVG